MKYLDRFFNTYPKRVFFVYLILVVWLIYYHYQNATLGYALFQVQDVDGLYAILNMSCMPNIIIGRLVLAYLSFINTSGGMLYTLLSMMNVPLLLFLILFLMFWFHRVKEPVLHRARWHLLFVVFAQWMMIVIVFGLGIVALRSETALLAIGVIHRMGVVLGISQIIFTLLHIYMLFDTLYQLQDRA